MHSQSDKGLVAVQVAASSGLTRGRRQAGRSRKMVKSARKPREEPGRFELTAPAAGNTATEHTPPLRPSRRPEYGSAAHQARADRHSTMVLVRMPSSCSEYRRDRPGIGEGELPGI
jgi:hypothetical protein